MVLVFPGQSPRWRLHRLMSQPSRCVAHVYSYRNASIGDTRAARRAGVYAASRASVTITAAPKTIGATLCTGRPGIRLATKRLPQYASSTPITRPAALIPDASRSTIRVMSVRVAPSATRIPISLMRRATVQAKGREHRAQRAEQPGHQGAEAFGNDRAIHLAVQRPHLLDGHGL